MTVLNILVLVCLLYVVLLFGVAFGADRAAQARFVEDRTRGPVATMAAEQEVPVRFGHCEIEGEPRVALVDFGGLLEQKNGILGELWDQYDVDSIHADWDTIERILFGYAAGRLIEASRASIARWWMNPGCPCGRSGRWRTSTSGRRAPVCFGWRRRRRRSARSSRRTAPRSGVSSPRPACASTAC